MVQFLWRRYCTLLQATMPHVPNVMPIEPKELLEFCSDAGYNCRLEPRGSWFTPPDYNVGMTDWERSLRLRCVHASALPNPVSVEQTEQQALVSPL